MKRAICLLVVLAAAVCLARDGVLTGTWKAKTTGSKEGKLDLSMDHRYRLELAFKEGKILQQGTYKVVGQTLTLSPKKALIRGDWKTMPADVPEIVLNLKWQGKDRVQASALRAGISKITSLELWR